VSAALLITCLAALVVSAAVTALALAARVLDFPNLRSSHDKPTPRGGGLGVLAGLGAGALAASFTGVPAAGLGALLGVTGLFAALGLADDLVTVPTKLKFALFAALCLALAWLAGPVSRVALTLELGVDLPIWLGLIGSALFVFVTVNAANFMDGSDGMLCAVMIPASLALGVAGLVAGAGEASLIGLALAGALAGFAGFNRPPARIFAGDVGSLSVGAAYAGGALAMAGQGFSGSLWLAPLLVLVFLADVLLTLLRRARHGRFSLEAHREHAYQRLIQSGWSHGRVALVYGALSTLIAISALVAAQGPDGLVPAVFAVWVAILGGLYALVSRRAGAA
jgi:UDP-N-acetylmuramyl pentapeptide phosphotransferase/UDP-N-acetylglucosamine-1-phosphate transferase